MLADPRKFQYVVTNSQPSNKESLEKNLILAFYLRNAPNIFNDNKRTLDRMLFKQKKVLAATPSR